MIMPAGMTILTQAAGPQRIGRVMSVVGVPMLIGPILGPVLGGWLVDDVSWRWIFYVNIPIGVVALALASRILKPDKPQPRHRLDCARPAAAVARPGGARLRARRDRHAWRLQPARRRSCRRSPASR